MPNFTPNLALAKPITNENNWGTELNANFDAIDQKLYQAFTFPLGQAVDVSFSSTPVFDLSTSSVQHLVLTGNATSATAVNPRDGQIYIFVVEQDATGGRSFVWPSTFRNGGSISSAAGTTGSHTISIQQFIYLQSRGLFFAVTPLLYA